MKRRVLFFFPGNPFPAYTGAQKRCLEMLTGLKEIGCEVTLISSTLDSGNQWGSANIQGLKRSWVADVQVYRASTLDHRFRALLRRFYRGLKKRPRVNSVFYTPPGMRRWFTRIFHEISPDIVLMNYAYYDGLLNHRRSKGSVHMIDIHDLVTLNMRMRQALDEYLPKPPIDADAVDDQALNEDFFTRLGLAAYPYEFGIYDKYHYTISISHGEAERIKQNTKRTKVLIIPMTGEPCYIPNSYTGPALFPTGPNPFNIQGYLYFAKRVLPQVRKKVNSFVLQVTGSCCEYVFDKEGIALSGFVTDLKTIYESSKFVVCPVFGGTGQQIKIFEAMTHGVPVIALHAAAEESPIQHGVNGLVAHNADEFSDCVIQLWSNKELCSQLGHAARDTIAAEFSRSRLLEALSSVVNSK